MNVVNLTQIHNFLSSLLVFKIPFLILSCSKEFPYSKE